MRLAYLTCDFGVPAAGTAGSSVHVCETTRALRRAGHAVRLFSPVAGGDGAPGLEGTSGLPLDGPAAAAVRALERDVGRQPHLAAECRALLYSEFATRRLRPELEAFRPDAIYERHSLFSYAGLLLAEELGVPLLLEVNAPLPLEQASHRTLVLRRTARELERAVLRGAHAVVAVSEELAAYVRRRGVPAERVVVLPNGVDTERFRPSADGSGARAAMGLAASRVVGFVGSLKPWHDVGCVLAAVGRLAARDPSVHFLVVGQGPGAGQLEGLFHVTWTGAVEHGRVPELMSAMDVVVVPCSAGSAYFSPLKLFEGMAMGKPVVAARVGQAAELVGAHGCGLLYEPGDPADLADKISLVLHLEDGGAALGERGRAFVAASRTWAHNAECIAGLVGRSRRLPRAS